MLSIKNHGVTLGFPLSNVIGSEHLENWAIIEI